MKIFSVCFIGLLLCFALTLASEELSIEKQKEIIDNYMYVTGQSQTPSASSLNSQDLNDTPLKCGTPAILDFILNRDKLDPQLLKSTGAQVAVRPTGLDNTLISPSGRFLIHYTTTGEDAVLYATYPDSVARIFDYVYGYLIDTLGYPTPPTDEFYPSGGDARFDVYLKNLGGSVFGLTYLDSARIDGVGSIRATAFMVLDNDYQEIYSYQSRPIEAVRVTCAHEFFHVIHFGIDFTEADVNGSYWMEMSATWMEEEIYDHINDYYAYLPYFFDSPWSSIQQFKSAIDLHPYASMLYPLFLSERYDRDVIRDIWLLCGSMGAGPNFLVAADSVIKTVSGGTDDFESAFSEFALWNYFTGSRADWAPSGIGYSERDSYTRQFRELPDTGEVKVHAEYPILVLGNTNPYNPDHNAAFYLKFDDLFNVNYDTIYNTTMDSIIEIDSVFTFGVALDLNFINNWGLDIIYKIAGYTDSIEIETLDLPPGQASGIGLDFNDPHQYESVVLILTPASSVRTYYDPNYQYRVSYLVDESIDVSIACPADTIDVYLQEPIEFCRPLPVAPSSAEVTTSIGDFYNDTLCLYFDTTGLYNVTVIAADSGAVHADTCHFVFNVEISSVSFMAPYPNPAVISEMVDPQVIFMISFPEDYQIYPDLTDPYLVIDIFNVAGEHINTISEVNLMPSGNNRYSLAWNLKNKNDNDVASGVYVAYARFYASSDKARLLTELKTKVALIR